MKRKAPTPSQFLGLLALLLLAASQTTTSCAARFVTPAHNLVVSLTSPVAGPLKAIGGKFRTAPDGEVDLGSRAQLERQLLRERAYNEQLRQHVQQLGAKLNQLAAVRRHRDLPDVRLFDADVTWTEGSDARALRINAGSRDGLVPALVVTDGINLVGRVASVEERFAMVRPITRAPSHLAATLRAADAEPDARGAIVQLTLDEKTGNRFLGRADAADNIAVGDLAHLDDRKWPSVAQGFLIGRVTAVHNDETDPLLRRIIVVEPLRNIAALRHVVVLLPGSSR